MRAFSLFSARLRCESAVGGGSAIRSIQAEDLNRLTDEQWAAFCDGVDAFIGVAGSACAATTEIEAADYWSLPFAHFFPMPDVHAELASDSITRSTSLVPVRLPDVLVRAVGKRNPNIRRTGTNAIGRIPKDCKITFEVIKPWKLPPGTIINWIVRNEGDEAEYTNDLGHRAGTGHTASENSAYNGTHYMDCTLRQNGRIYGVRRIPASDQWR